MGSNEEQLRLERALNTIIGKADGAVACHLRALDDETLRLLQEPKLAGNAAIVLYMALSDRLGYPAQAVTSEVLETFIELLETERNLEVARREGGGGFYAPSLAGAMVGYLRGGKEGLAQALELFPVLSDHEQERRNERSVD